MKRSADWMKQAERDLEHARSDVEHGFYEWACFLCQQAAEKAVRSVFQKLRAEAFGHSVAGLLEELPEHLKPSEELLDLAKELDKAYIPTRYPNAHPRGAPYEAYTRGEAERLVAHAERVLEFCKGLLSKV